MRAALARKVYLAESLLMLKELLVPSVERDFSLLMNLVNLWSRWQEIIFSTFLRL